MAIPRIKATYSLDAETMRVLERVAKRWGVSKSEALRRAIRATVAVSGPMDERAAALDDLQSAAGIGATSAKSWSESVRAERRATGATKTPKR
jgi:hypothetical protein